MAKADLLAALQAAMASAMPTRVVTRDFRDFAQRTSVELEFGVVTLIAHGTGDYGGTLSRFGTPGELAIMLTGQIKVAENAAPHAIEDAEPALLEEIEEFCQYPVPPLGNLVITSARQSGQIEHPYGWIACDLRLYL